MAAPPEASGEAAAGGLTRGASASEAGAGGLLPPGARVCIVLLGGIGDSVHGLPVGAAIKRMDPSARLTWVVKPPVDQLLAPHPQVDELVVFHRFRGLRGVLGLVRSMAGRRFDWTLNLDLDARSIFPVLLSRAPERVGWGRDRARDGVWLTANHHLPARSAKHQQDLVLDVLRYLGVPPFPVDWGLTFTSRERRAQREFFARFSGRPVAAIAPAAGRPEKDWLPDRYARIADALRADFGYEVMLLGGPGERETRLAREISDRARSRPVWALGDDVRRLLWLISGSNLLIAPDTGALHLARALEVPVIGLYAATNPKRFGPYARFPDLLVDRYVPGGAAGSNPMERIEAEDVLERVERARERYPRARGPA